MRAWPVLCAALLLGGCNMAHTDHPLFTAKDTMGAPAFRPGVWADPDPGCNFDPNLPVAKWPDCVHGDSAPKADPGASLLIVSGKPLIVQYGAKPGNDTPSYFYFAIEPLRLDAEGRIVAMKAWPVQCGPPHHEVRSDKVHIGTRHPLPGMTMDPDGNNCTVASAEAVRAAAIPSRAWALSAGAAYWVRDGDR
jgi:hypothetical protein